jgi:hypothetical protein
VFRRFTQQFEEMRRDIAVPLESESRLPRGARFRARTKRLVAKYGWRIVAAVFAFYLIRDLVLYVLLPYLAIRSFAW